MAVKFGVVSGVSPETLRRVPLFEEFDEPELRSLADSMHEANIPAGATVTALLWGIDQHNRLAHLGLALRPSFRGRGWSIEVLRLLCLYGFDVRGLNRLQLETAEDNRPMTAAARRAGFEIEGTLREATWILGNFVDTVVMGLLAANWRDATNGT